MPLPPNPRKPQQQPQFQLWWLWVGLLAIMVFGMIAGGGGREQYQSIPFSQFQELLDQGKVKNVVVTGEHLQG
ncbi:MAG: ATP-dependent metallopeptidase FtsH/Yme1/Tma family protein, partial [Acetobacteraceae bacterium]